MFVLLLTLLWFVLLLTLLWFVLFISCKVSATEAAAAAT
jgi:hypothetical protein